MNWKRDDEAFLSPEYYTSILK